MSDALDLDLDAIEAALSAPLRCWEAPHTLHDTVSRALVAEVRRLRAEVDAAEVRGARWALDALGRAVHVEVPALFPAEVCRARRGR